MHETSVCQRLLAQVLAIAEREQAAAVTSIALRVGALSGIDPTQVAEAFPQASAGTPAESARLDIDLAPVRVRCLACGIEGEVTPERLDCRACGSEETRLLDGTDLLITNVELAL